MNRELLDYFNGDELAANVWLSKYAMDGEETPDDMHRRMAKEFARIEEKYQNATPGVEQTRSRNLDPILSKYGQEREHLSEENIYEFLFKDFKYIIPQGSIMYGLGRNIPVSLSNCFVVDSPKDSYGGIMLTDQEQAQLMKRRGGVGYDLSLLRPKNTKVNNSAQTSTGMASFMHRFSNTTREVAQSGRRGALMLSIDINHPDVMDFIKIKRDGTSVTGANISVKLNDEFMKAVENDEDYLLQFPCENLPMKTPDLSSMEYNKLYKGELVKLEGNLYIKKIRAKEYWDEIVKSAKNHAEPGLMYWDNVIDYDPAGVYEQYKPVSSNPCGEQFLQGYDSCRLMAINLFSFVSEPFTKNAALDLDHLYKVSYEQQRLADNLVDLEIEYIERIINKIKTDDEPYSVKEVEINLWNKIKSTAKKGRRTGCGITALGDMLAALGLKYDSKEGIEITELVMKTKMEAELDCNIDLAILRSPFEGWDVSKEFYNREGDVYQIGNLPLEFGANNFYKFILHNFPTQFKRMQQYGRRSVSWSTIAPTGSVSILTQTTSGCEPIFQPFYMRRKKINPDDRDVRVDFVDESGDSWQEFPVLHQRFKEWINSNFDSLGLSGQQDIEDEMSQKDLQIAFEKSPWYGSTANDIDWEKRNMIQSVLQKYTTNAISSTINLPSTTTEKEVSDIYMSGWKMGLKGQTVYVDGSRSGVLVSNNENTKRDSFEYVSAVKRPKEVECDVHTTTSDGKKYNVIVGLIDDKPYEVFITKHLTNETKLTLKKIKRGKYALLKNDEVYIDDITSEMTELEESITRMTSLALRHGADIKYSVEQLNKTPSTNMFSFTKSLARVLKKYIPDGSKSSATCSDCGGSNIIYEEGCMSCKDCGSSKCS